MTSFFTDIALAIVFFQKIVAHFSVAKMKRRVHSILYVVFELRQRLNFCDERRNKRIFFDDRRFVEFNRAHILGNCKCKSNWSGESASALIDCKRLC